jgi:hypothetical protein
MKRFEIPRELRKVPGEYRSTPSPLGRIHGAETINGMAEYDDVTELLSEIGKPIDLNR